MNKCFCADLQDTSCYCSFCYNELAEKLAKNTRMKAKLLKLLDIKDDALLDLQKWKILARQVMMMAEQQDVDQKFNQWKLKQERQE